MNEVPEITEEQIHAFLREKMHGFGALSKSYSCLHIEVVNYSGPPVVKCSAYIETLGHTYGDTVEEAIAGMRSRLSEQSEADRLRQQAASLLAKADRIDAAGVLQ